MHSNYYVPGNAVFHPGAIRKNRHNIIITLLYSHYYPNRCWHAFLCRFGVHVPIKYSVLYTRASVHGQRACGTFSFRSFENCVSKLQPVTSSPPPRFRSLINCRQYWWLLAIDTCAWRYDWKKFLLFFLYTCTANLNWRLNTTRHVLSFLIVHALT